VAGFTRGHFRFASNNSLGKNRELLNSPPRKLLVGVIIDLPIPTFEEAYDESALRTNW
jgi:hypothetical protein